MAVTRFHEYAQSVKTSDPFSRLRTQMWSNTPKNVKLLPIYFYYNEVIVNLKVCLP